MRDAVLFHMIRAIEKIRVPGLGLAAGFERKRWEPKCK